jgi:ribonucleoside-diphosphate reductase alpha chain
MDFSLQLLPEQPLAELCDALSVSVSLGLQHGVPLRLFVRHHAHIFFAPARRTDDPQLPITTSLVDYIFQRLALTYIPYQDLARLVVLAGSLWWTQGTSTSGR